MTDVWSVQYRGDDPGRASLRPPQLAGDAAPLILLAQTRQADRDKAHTEADAQHRDALAVASAERQALAAQQTTQIMALLEQNTELTRLTQELTKRIEGLTVAVHGRIVRDGA